MASLEADFNELIRRIQAGRDFAHASFDPVYYLVFGPRELLEVKRAMSAWTSRLNNAGWRVETFSFSEHIADILVKAPARRYWLTPDRQEPLSWERTTVSLANTLAAEGGLLSRLRDFLAALKGQDSTLALVTDLEALHPYMRIGAIEAQLQGEFYVSTVFLYPGVRTGTTKLKFLGFYPEDGNYRSVHVGG